MKKIVILTGSEMRHTYFRVVLSNDKRFKVLASFCEGSEKSLESRTFSNIHSSILEKQHVLSRKQSEKDFFGATVSNLTDDSNPVKIAKGDINKDTVVEEIKRLKPDILVCYGSSLIKSDLLTVYDGHFLNVHLGLSPYYRGSGTNVWPLINKEPWMVGATFMYIDSGIDTGNIIHQIQPSIFLGDSPHTIGNRLILEMTKVYSELVVNFRNLSNEVQPESQGRLYKKADFNSNACRRLYDNFNNGMIEEYINNPKQKKYIVKNRAIGTEL
jgi:folate-dependent phosphoribosylglycinamide formyltransferase PurN